jgi:hypothetical protein
MLLTLLLSACAGGVAAPPAPAPDAGRAAVVQAKRTITAQDMERRIGALAADSMRGRDTPSPELEKAATYLAHEFRTMGLEPAGDNGTFIQRWPYVQAALDPAAVVLRLRGQAATAPRYGVDYFLVPGTQARVEGPVYYAGSAAQVTELPAAGRGAVILFDLPLAELGAEWQTQLVSALGIAMRAGAAAVGVVLDPAFPPASIAELAPQVAGQQAPVPVFGVSRRAAEAMFTAAGTNLQRVRPPAAVGRAVIEIEAARTGTEHQPPNVVAMIRGRDPALRNTYVVLTAHFDHVGVGAPDATGDSIFNGADDNASGTAALVEIAQAFAALPERPARSVLFLAVSGEEKGLLGSMHFARNPTVPREGIIANINMDMISRNAPDTLIAIGQEYSTFEQILEEVLAAHPEVGLTVIRDPYPQEQLFFRSDQLSFIQQGIPALFFFTGLHEDYHRQSDRPERSKPDKAARVAQLAFLIAHRVANDPTAPQWTEEGRRQVEAILRGGF